MITNPQSRTNVHEIAEGIFRINTPVGVPGGPSFNFNQYLIVDDEPLLFHTGPRRLFALVREAVASVLPVERLRWVGFSHTEADECGALNHWLEVAPQARPLCGRIAALTSIGDLADRPPRALGDGERLVLGRHALQWIDTPHVPHGWDAGLLMEVGTGTLLCGDLFTDGDSGATAVTESDILGPSEAFRGALDYFSHAPQTAATLARLAALKPVVLARMHGSAWRGDGAAALRHLAESLAAGRQAKPGEVRG